MQWFPVRPTDEDLTTSFVQVVLFAVTTNCNLRCTYCGVSHPAYRGEDFDLSHIDELTEGLAAAHVRMVQISGHGETTMLPGWERLGAAFQHRGITVCITSNFSKTFSAAEIDALAEMGHITVSIDTVDRELLKALRRKVDLRTILYNMQMVRLRAAQTHHRPVTFNWQCTLSDAVVAGLPDWLELGILSGVTHFTLGNLIEYEALPDSPQHVAKLDREKLATACDILAALARRARDASVVLTIQPGIVEGINERRRALGVNEMLRIDAA
jgi:MoaA/NifB/PqqE/SkfB family radical SAM enzyme